MDMVLVDGWICHGSVLFFKWGRDTGERRFMDGDAVDGIGRNADAMAVR